MEEREKVNLIFREIKKISKNLEGAFAHDLKLNNFQLLISILISSRTNDKITFEVSKRIKKRVKDANDILKMSIEDIEKLIYPVGFYKRKAKQIKELAKIIIRKGIPNSEEELIKLPGVGKKVAKLFLQIAFNKGTIAVDVHVHRVTNRIFGLNLSKAEVEKFWKENLPKKEWKEVNRVLVKFGQNICKAKPKCGLCKIKKFCEYYKNKKNYSSG